MDILKKSLAPITDKAWEEIELQSNRVIREFTSGRRFANIEGPLGLEHGSVSTGRLIVPPNQPKEGIKFGIREVVPMVEIRKNFTLDLWELDNASRNAKDVELKNLEKALQQVAAFEDEFLYHGFKDTHSPGMVKAAKDKPVKFSPDASKFIEILLSMIASMKRSAVEGPYTLVVPDQVWRKMAADNSAYPFSARVKEITGGSVITHHFNKEIFLISERGGDIELVLGQDISLGYEDHDTEKVKLYITESFTYRILSPEAYRVMLPE